MASRTHSTVPFRCKLVNKHVVVTLEIFTLHEAPAGGPLVPIDTARTMVGCNGLPLCGLNPKLLSQPVRIGCPYHDGD